MADAPEQPTTTPIYDYGYFKSPHKFTKIEVLLRAYAAYEHYRLHDGVSKTRRHPSEQYPSKAYIFKEIAQMLWGEKNKQRQFKWHPWADKMNERCHEHPITGQLHPHVALNGCGTSGKSDFGAIYAIINWMADPLNTLVLTTTTDLNAGSRRIWGAIEKYFNAVRDVMPGVMVSSLYRINSTDRTGKKVSGQCGILLVPGEKKKEKECLEKLIGAKAGKSLILIADELPDLVMSILSTFFGNLITAAKRTQIVAMGNFCSRYDAFGIMCKPKDGWDSINIESEEWETDIVLPETDSRISGYCVRFDGMKSPNILAGQDIYPIYSSKHLKQHKELGEKSAQFWRFCRSFDAPTGIEKTLYTESDFRAGHAYEHPLWLSSDVKYRVSSLDPAIKTGGDRCVQRFGWYGQDANGKWVLDTDKKLVLREDVTKKDEPFDLQISKQAIANCEAQGVKPEHFGIDATGTGAGVYSHVWEKWSPKVLRVEFGGAPSQLQVVANDELTAEDRFDRRVSELWGVGKEFLKYGQLKGIDDELAREMKSREFKDTKRARCISIAVEIKVDMKKRIGFSPDDADAYFVLIEVCRVRFGWKAAGGTAGHKAVQESWREQVEKNNLIYLNVAYEPEQIAEVI